jgi:hypothetical protein
MGMKNWRNPFSRYAHELMIVVMETLEPCNTRRDNILFNPTNPNIIPVVFTDRALI